jgi:hypothetical protein
MFQINNKKENFLGYDKVIQKYFKYENFARYVEVDV